MNIMAGVLQTATRGSVGLLTFVQLGLVIVVGVYGVLVTQSYGSPDDDGHCYVGFNDGDATSYEMAQVTLLSLAGFVALVIVVANALEIDSKTMMAKPLLSIAAVFIGVSISVGAAAAFTGRCQHPQKDLDTDHFEPFVWILFSLLLVSAFLQVTVQNDKMDSKASVAEDMAHWSAISSLTIVRFIFLLTLVIMMGDGVLYKVNDKNTHIIDLDSTTGPNGFTCQISLVRDKNNSKTSVRDRLDAFKTINIIETLSFNNSQNVNTSIVSITPAPPTSNPCNNLELAQILANEPTTLEPLQQCIDSNRTAFETLKQNYCDSHGAAASGSESYASFNIINEFNFWLGLRVVAWTPSESNLCSENGLSASTFVDEVGEIQSAYYSQNSHWSWTTLQNDLTDGCITTDSQYVDYYALKLGNIYLQSDDYCFCSNANAPSTGCLCTDNANIDPPGCNQNIQSFLLNAGSPADHFKNNTSPLTLEKVEGYNPMLAALYVGFVCSVLTAGLVGASIVLRDNFDVFTLTLPGMFEKTFQLAADIITSLFIASLLLENEMNGCQVWNLSNTAVQCALVSGLLYIYIVVVMAFVSSNRRLQHMSEEGGTTFKSFVSYAAM